MVKITEEVKNNRAKWIRALRGGRYRQIDGALRRIVHGYRGGTIGYCCLGVACQISKLGKWEEKDTDYYYANGDKSDSGLNQLPSVRKWLGMTKRQNGAAITMNDEDGLSFEQIAERFKEIWRMK